MVIYIAMSTKAGGQMHAGDACGTGGEGASCSGWRAEFVCALLPRASGGSLCTLVGPWVGGSLEVESLTVLASVVFWMLLLALICDWRCRHLPPS